MVEEMGPVRITGKRMWLLAVTNQSEGGGDEQLVLAEVITGR